MLLCFHCCGCIDRSGSDVWWHYTETNSTSANDFRLYKDRWQVTSVVFSVFFYSFMETFVLFFLCLFVTSTCWAWSSLTVIKAFCNSGKRVTEISFWFVYDVWHCINTFWLIDWLAYWLNIAAYCKKQLLFYHCHCFLVSRLIGLSCWINWQLW